MMPAQRAAENVGLLEQETNRYVCVVCGCIKDVPVEYNYRWNEWRQVEKSAIICCDSEMERA